MNQHINEMNVPEKIVNAFNSPSAEIELKKLDANIIIKKDINTTSYLLQMPIEKMFGLMKPLVFSFEIKKDSTSKTLVWNNLMLTEVDYRIDSLKKN